VDENSDTFVQLFDEEISKAALMQALEGTKRIVTYNGRSIPDAVKNRVGFDFPVIAAQLGVVLARQGVPTCRSMPGMLEAQPLWWS
jgi:hypothetical protein